MCTRCVRFTREVTGTAELTVQGRGNKEEIDIFPGIALDNELSANVIDPAPSARCWIRTSSSPKRVWFPARHPSTHHRQRRQHPRRHQRRKIYRLKPRTNMAVNKWWISDEIRQRLQARPLGSAYRRPSVAVWRAGRVRLEPQRSLAGSRRGSSSGSCPSSSVPCRQRMLISSARLPSLDPRSSPARPSPDRRQGQDLPAD